MVQPIGWLVGLPLFQLRGGWRLDGVLLFLSCPDYSAHVYLISSYEKSVDANMQFVRIVSIRDEVLLCPKCLEVTQPRHLQT